MVRMVFDKLMMVMMVMLAMMLMLVMMLMLMSVVLKSLPVISPSGQSG